MGKITKKVLMTLLVAMMFFSVLPGTILAETGESQKTETLVNAAVQKDEAAKIAKEKLHITSEYELANINFNSTWGYGEKGVWFLYWVQKNDKQTLSSINVVVDSENGEILAVDNYYNTNENVFYPAKVSVVDAKKVADEFIKSFYPDLTNKIELDKSYIENYKPTLYGPIYYNFPYRFLVNGVPFADGNISVQVNGNGTVTGFHYASTFGIEFEDVNQYISIDEAKNYLSKELSLQLNYLFPFNSQEENSAPYLAYVSSTSNSPINAKTGELINLYGQMNQTTSIQPLIDKPVDIPKKQDQKELSQDEILDLAKKYFEYFGVQVDEISNISYNSDHYQTKHGSWNLSWQMERELNQEKPGLFGGITIDAITGEILSFYNNDYSIDESSENKIDYEKAKEIAIEAVKKMAPYKADEVYLQEDTVKEYTKDSKRMYFYFKRLVHGIPTERDGIRVTVNLETGNITDYGLNWVTSNYPEEVPNTISMDDAKNIIIDHLKLELVYINSTHNKDSKDRKAILVYKQKNNYGTGIFLDATSGEWRSREDGSLINPVPITDIKGHEAEKELQLMIDFKALEVEDGKVNPDKNITRGELIKMFLMANSGGNYHPNVSFKEASFSDVPVGSKYFGFVEDALRLNIISANDKNFNPDQEVTRDELAQLIVKALGYEKLAQTKGLFKIEYLDQLTSDYSGEIAIVTSLDIMSGDGAYFNPKGKVTKANAAVAFYKYLKIRNQYQEVNVPTYY